MSNTPCPFNWYELLTTDVEAAKSFYGALFGWGFDNFGGPNGDYFVVNVGGYGIGGVMTLPKDAAAAGMPPNWGGYIAVDDVDAYTGRVQEKGGRVYREPQDIPGAGRFAVVADPQCAVFMLITPDGEAPENPPAPNTPGLVGWRELHTVDSEAAFAFYSELFHWTELRAVDMGPHGTYHVFSAGENQQGGIMKKMDEQPMPHWLFYFHVPGTEVAAARVSELGGKILMAPTQVPTGDWVAVCLDPQGAVFALISGSK